ncbi:MAG: HAD-IIIA family hydrolase [Clostridia bacterium]|nr:HAD-IIIA family hydrolase [Clostridia bacterium]
MKLCYTMLMENGSWNIKCILFDRDGTLGELADKRYPQTFTPFCDVANIFARLKQKGYLVGLITNQSSIARGTGRGYDFASEFQSYGADIWEICPHDDKDGCTCRKPKSGLLSAAAEKLRILPTECMVVGDRLSDVQCANNLGAKAALVLTGFGKSEKKNVLAAYPDTLVLERFDQLLQLLP